MEITLQHIHLIAKDKYELAKWYEKNLGFKIIDDIEKLGELGGPLFVSGDNGKTALSIFTDNGKIKDTRTLCIPAFGTDYENFLYLFNHFKDNVENELKIIDHYLFFSFYTNDPTGTRIEITCTDYENCKKFLETKSMKYHKV